MLQDIFPSVYHNEMSFAPPSPEDLALVCREDGILLAQRADGLCLPTVGQCSGGNPWRYAFSIDQTRYYLAGSPASAPGFAPCRDSRQNGPAPTVFACAVGQSLARWYRANRYCGGCGKPMGHSGRERALVCPACGQTVYPKLAPAVIVAVCDGDRLLLTKYAGRAFTRYALVAGFAEIGETIEETAAREVREETGLEIRNLRFYKSQPWVVTDSLLFGFYADLSGSSCPHIQQDELSLAQWFPRSRLPEDYSPDSLTGEMIHRFAQGLEPKSPAKGLPQKAENFSEISLVAGAGS